MLPSAGVEGILPPGGVEGRPLEQLHAGNLREPRFAQPPACNDQHPGPLDAVLRGDFPEPVGLVPVHRLDVDTQAEVFGQPLVANRVVQVPLDLSTRGIEPAPGGIGEKGVGIQVGGDVAGDAGVHVVVPRPADLVPAFEDRKVPVSGTPELDAQPDPGESRPDDGKGQRRFNRCPVHAGSWARTLPGGTPRGRP